MGGKNQFSPVPFFFNGGQVAESLGDIIRDGPNKTGAGMPDGSVSDFGNGQAQRADGFQSLVDPVDVFVIRSGTAVRRHDDGEDFGFSLFNQVSQSVSDAGSVMGKTHDHRYIQAPGFQ